LARVFHLYFGIQRIKTINMLLHLLLGGIAGWLAGRVMRGAGYGVIVDVILGVLGGWLGGYLARKLGFHFEGSAGYLFMAFIGAVLLVWISRLIRGRRRRFI
jgi:uncharacterized membrane protein YeaQ/YmgE (transglycosylase-associated protein family)